MTRTSKRFFCWCMSDFSVTAGYTFMHFPGGFPVQILRSSQRCVLHKERSDGDALEGAKIWLLCLAVSKLTMLQLAESADDKEVGLATAPIIFVALVMFLLHGRIWCQT